MRISELTINNFRALEGEHIFRFSSNITLIAGVNGRGKTAILDALVLCLSRLVPKISPSKARKVAFKINDISLGFDEALINIKANCAGFPVDFSTHYTNDKIEFVTSLPQSLRIAISNVYGDPSHGDDQAPLAVFYSTDRASFKIPRLLPSIVLDGQSMAYNQALVSRLIDYKDLMFRYQYADSQQASFGSHVIVAINAAISQLMSDFGNLRVETEPSLRLVINKGEKVIDIKQLSDGERSFVALISDLGRRLALANPDLANPLLGAGVVLIDEIELHLHPKWQLELLENLRNIFPNIQFIVTTHSPYIIQTAREGELISLDGAVTVDPYGKSLEEVSKYIMDVENSEYSPRINQMKQTAEKYLELAASLKGKAGREKEEIQKELNALLEPFTDDVAYTALLKAEGKIKINEANQ